MTRNAVQRLFEWKVRGIRWIEIIGVLLVAVMILSVYVAKAAAARESATINQLERQIAETRQRVRLLRAEAARLEQPARLEVLSRGAGLAPVEMDQQADGVALSTLRPAPEPVLAPVEVAPVVVETPADAAPVGEGLR